MKPGRIIISRKGFDSASGGCPSPIFPDGTMYSLPVPGFDEEKPIRYRDLYHDHINIGQVVEDLTRGRHPARHLAGLDPDIRLDAVHRSEGWRGLFGQVGPSQTHLANQSVQDGDVFLFFGLFRRVEEIRTGWHFIRGAPNLHVLWGWLQIEKVRKVEEIRHHKDFEWATYHCQFRWYGDPRNTIYIATDRLNLNDTDIAAGAGVFPKVHERLVLTQEGRPVSNWRLPRFFYPGGGKTPLTYHPDLKRWGHDQNHAYLRSAGRGQEFVLHCDEYPEAVEWLSGLVREFGQN